MKSTPKVTDGPTGAGPRVAEDIGTRPGSAFGTGISESWAVKTSDRRGLNVLTVVWAAAPMLGPKLVGLDGLDGGVTNTSKESSSTRSELGLGGRGMVGLKT
jgi:hypothetical protein